MAENEFSDAFSTAYDADAGTGICYPSDTDWSCAFTPDELVEIRSTPEGSAALDRAEAFGWSLLAALCAYRLGTCPITVRPCVSRCLPGGSFTGAIAGGSGIPSALSIGRMSPYISGGSWYNACGCRTSCSCTALSEVILPGPVGGIASVYVGGELLPRGSYRVDNGSRLVRVDGGEWPACQDMTLSDEDGFSVTYYRGSRPNAITKAAAGALANEFYLACAGAECRLPNNVTNAARQGESYNMELPSFFDGDTNIPEVDAVVRIYNPYRLKSVPTIASPDDDVTRVPTWI